MSEFAAPKKRGRPKGSKNRPRGERTGPRHSPLERTLKLLRQRGGMAEKAERSMRAPGRPFFRRDLFRFLDVVAVMPGQRGVLGVQVCRDGDAARHEAKLRSEAIWPRVLRWLEADNPLVLHVWHLERPSALTFGLRQPRWIVEERTVTAMTHAPREELGE